MAFRVGAMNTQAKAYQFSLLTLLLITTLVGVLIGWWVDRSRLQGQTDELRRRVQLLETSRYFDGAPELQEMTR